MIIQHEFTLLAQICANGCSWDIFFSIFKATSFFCLRHSQPYLYLPVPGWILCCLLPQLVWLHGNDWYRSNRYCWLIYQYIGLLIIVIIKVLAFIYRPGNKTYRKWKPVLCCFCTWRALGRVQETPMGLQCLEIRNMYMSKYSDRCNQHNFLISAGHFQYITTSQWTGS